MTPTLSVNQRSMNSPGYTSYATPFLMKGNLPITLLEVPNTHCRMHSVMKLVISLVMSMEGHGSSGVLSSFHSLT